VFTRTDWAYARVQSISKRQSFFREHVRQHRTKKWSCFANIYPCWLEMAGHFYFFIILLPSTAQKQPIQYTYTNQPNHIHKYPDCSWPVIGRLLVTLNISNGIWSRTILTDPVVSFLPQRMEIVLFSHQSPHANQCFCDSYPNTHWYLFIWQYLLHRVHNGKQKKDDLVSNNVHALGEIATDN
jgi:hypothetical protein